MKNVWDYVWNGDSYSDPELRKAKANYKLEIFKKYINLKEDSLCVDVGCGGGYISKEINSVFKCNVYSLDSSRSAIEYAIKNNSFEKSEYVNEPANRINLTDSSADLILCIGVLEHIKDIQSTLNELNRILKPSGKYVIISSNKYSIIYLQRLFKQAIHIWRYGYQKNWKAKKLIKVLKENNFDVDTLLYCDGYGDFNKTNKVDKLINILFPFWSRYIMIVGGKKND